MPSLWLFRNRDSRASSGIPAQDVFANQYKHRYSPITSIVTSVVLPTLRGTRHRHIAWPVKLEFTTGHFGIYDWPFGCTRVLNLIAVADSTPNIGRRKQPRKRLETRLKTLREFGLRLPNTWNGTPTRAHDQKEPGRVPTTRCQVPRKRAHGLSGKRAGRPAGHGRNLGPYRRSYRGRASCAERPALTETALSKWQPR